MNTKTKKYLRKSLKVLLWIVGSIIGLFLLIILLLQIPYVQNKVKDKAVAYLEKKIGTEVKLGSIEIGLPKKVILQDFYFESQNGDTLLAGDKLAVDISLIRLLSNEVEINSINLEGVTANVQRGRDSVFNFDYIIDAFASNKPKDTTSAPMKFSIDKVNLNRIKLRFNDAISGNNLSAAIGHFDTRIKKFDLDKLEFDVPKAKLSGLKVRLQQGMVAQIAQGTQELAEEASKRPDLKLRLGEISLEDIDVGYDNVGSRLDTGMRLKKLDLVFNAIDLKDQLIDISKIKLDGLDGQLVFGKFEKQVQEALPEETAAVKQAQWKLKLKDADIANVAFRFNDMNAAPVKKGIDYKHLDITNFSLKAKDFSYAPDAISGEVAQLTVRDKSGLDIRELRTKAVYNERGASLTDLYLETPQTLLQDKIVVQYPSVDYLKKDIGEMAVDANLDNSTIGFKDILLFVPTLSQTNPFRAHPEGILAINSRVTGKVKDLKIDNLEIAGIGSTNLAASGRITGLPDVNKAYFNLYIRDLHTTSRDIAGLVPPGTLPANLRLPSTLSANATFKGTLVNFSTNANISSSFGNAKVKALLDRRRKGAERYDADAMLTNFNLGALLKNDSIGRISMRAVVKGTGLDPETASAVVKAKVIKAEYNSYAYKNLNVDGRIARGKFDAKARMADPNLDFNLVASGGFDGKYPKGELKLNVDIADLDKLNLHAGPLKLRGNVYANFTDGNPDNLNGMVSLHHFMFANEKGQYGLDSVNITAISTAEKNSIVLKSQLANAKIEGKYKLTEVGNAISNTIAKYYKSNPSYNKKATGKTYFDFSLHVNNDPVLSDLVPSIKRLEPIDIRGRYNSEGDTITMKGSIPRVVYGNYTLSGGDINVETKDGGLAYNIKVDEVQSEQLLIPHTSIVGVLRDDLLNYRLQILDKKDKEQYMVAGQLHAADGNTELSLNPDGLMLNYQNWTVAANNQLKFGKDGIHADNFELKSEGAVLSLQSQSAAANAPLNVKLDDFKIETITNMVLKKELKVNGTIDGTAELRDLANKPVFTSDLTIANLSVANDTVGDVRIKVDNKIADTYTADVAITGNGNQVDLDGTYRATDSSFNLDLNIGTLNTASMQAFTFGNITEGSGYLNGRLKVTGNVNDPNINGNLKFNDVAFRVTQLNSYFRSMNDNIVFTDAGIRMNNFTVEDENNNILQINGTIATTDYKTFGLGMSVDAENFRAINSTAKDNDLFYGDLYLDAHLKVTGTADTPVVNGNLKINEDTSFTVVLPQQDPRIADREGIVEFIDQDDMEAAQRLKIEQTLNSTAAKGMDVSVAIEIVKEAELNLIVDKGNGDFLHLQGEARLIGGIDPSGKTSLTGRYEFTEGAYQMSFNFIKRKFDIQKGSYILWTGEPTKADLSITAVYETQTAPIDLLDNQLGGVSQSVRNTYKQRIPFQALLKINGQLLKPELSFDIVLPERNYNVSTDIVNNTRTKLEQLRQEPSELNKQVFALLLLNRFIGENPFSSEAGGDNAESIARQSVSKILSEQLNNLAADLIKGVQLDFDLESTDDYTTGDRANRTDLNVGLSKTLFDDRLKVTVGSSFGLEGPQQPNQETTNIAGDVAVDYQLTRDGRYMVRAYRKNEYQVALQGQVIETGVAFIITMDYNKFRELFHRSEAEKEMLRREREKDARDKADEERQKEKENEAKKQALPPNTTKNE